MRWLDHREALPESLRGGIIALGNFDGFHKGHQAVAGEAIRWARETGRPSIVATLSNASPAASSMVDPSNFTESKSVTR